MPWRLVLSSISLITALATSSCAAPDPCAGKGGGFFGSGATWVPPTTETTYRLTGDADLTCGQGASLHWDAALPGYESQATAVGRRLFVRLFAPTPDGPTPGVAIVAASFALDGSGPELVATETCAGPRDDLEASGVVGNEAFSCRTPEGLRYAATAAALEGRLTREAGDAGAYGVVLDAPLGEPVAVALRLRVTSTTITTRGQCYESDSF